MLSREAFITLLAHGYKNFEALGEDIDTSAENFRLLCDLIHNSLSNAFL
jgi:hypothetical protein